MAALRRHLYILDVGHGNCAVITGGEDETVVVDVATGSTLLEFLAQQEIQTISTVYLSHADEDHIGALVGLLASRAVTIGKVVVNSDASKNTDTWNDLVFELDEARRAGALEFKVGLAAGEREDLDDVEVRVLGPSQYLVAKGVGGTNGFGRRISSNSMSAFIRVSVSGRPVAVLPGDIDRVGLDDLVGKVGDVRAPVLVYPHHGGRPGGAAVRPFAEKLLGAVSPVLVVFSFGRGRYGAPNPETVTVLRETMPNARIVCTQLSEHCAAALPRESPSHLSDEFAAGRESRACCGGTMVVPLNGVQDLEPRRAEHLKFIESNAETARCLRGPTG